MKVSAFSDESPAEVSDSFRTRQCGHFLKSMQSSKGPCGGSLSSAPEKRSQVDRYAEIGDTSIVREVKLIALGSISSAPAISAAPTKESSGAVHPSFASRQSLCHVTEKRWQIWQAGVYRKVHNMMWLTNAYNHQHMHC